VFKIEFKFGCIERRSIYRRLKNHFGWEVVKKSGIKNFMSEFFPEN